MPSVARIFATLPPGTIDPIHVTGNDATGSELQTLVEALSLAVERPVLLDDAALVPIAYSPQGGEVDEVRERSILGRGATRQVRDALLGQGIAGATGPVRTAPDHDLSMAGRLCVPVRVHGITLGFLWLVDPDETVGSDDIARVEKAAERAGQLLSSRPDASLEEETRLIAGLCSEVESDRAKARERAVNGGKIADRPLVAVRVAALGEVVRLGDFARRTIHRVSAGHVLAGRVSGGLMILLDLDEPALSVLDRSELAHWVHGAADLPLAVGQSEAIDGLGQVPEASRQAELALRVARTRPEGSEYAAWDTIGVDRIVSQLPPEALEDVPPALRRLITEEAALAATLAAYLEAAGDIKQTAAILSLHRSGLYYRLHRIEELTGLDLGKGEDRLLAQLALRLSRQSS